MSLTLYHGEPNGPSLTVLAALFAKEVPAELEYIDLTRGERHTLPFAQEPLVAMSIEGEGPVLVADGEAMSDSVFLACYLDDVGRGAALRPADPYQRWETMRWCRQLIERTAPAAALLGCHARPPQPAEGVLGKMASLDLRARWREILAGAARRQPHQDPTGRGANRGATGQPRVVDGRVLDRRSGELRVACGHDSARPGGIRREAPHERVARACQGTPGGRTGAVARAHPGAFRELERRPRDQPLGLT
jgi:GST-like protein